MKKSQKQQAVIATLVKNDQFLTSSLILHYIPSSVHLETLICKIYMNIYINLGINNMQSNSTICSQSAQVCLDQIYTVIQLSQFKSI